MRNAVLSLVSLAALSISCGDVAQPAQTSQAVHASNGAELNGAKLNGAKLNGAKLNGAKLNGAKLNGAKLNGAKLNGASLVAVTAEGEELEGEALEGVELEGELSDGNVLPLRIDSVRRSYSDDEDDDDGDDAERDIRYYRVSYFDGDLWQPLCGADPFGRAVEAIALRGAWNYDIGVEGGGSRIDAPGLFTFACRGSALAKCAEWGYKPWATAQRCTWSGCTVVSLADHHQACTRLVRADYCGDGRTWTFNGTLINVYDGVGINADTERWNFEAEWRAEGAACVRSSRVATGQLYNTMPAACVERLVSRSCGDRRNFSRGTLLMSEYSLWFTTYTEGSRTELYSSFNAYE